MYNPIPEAKPDSGAQNEYRIETFLIAEESRPMLNNYWFRNASWGISLNHKEPLLQPLGLPSNEQRLFCWEDFRRGAMYASG